MEQRIVKLLILAGDESAQFQSRDFARVNEVIVGQYLEKNQEEISNIIISKLTLVIEKIPLKQHIYAGLTTKISIKSKDISNQIIHLTLTNLEKALSSFEFYESLNIIAFLSELMNISLLNSLTLLNIFEDILDKIEATNSQIFKRFLVSILIRSLPVCINSLSEKLFQDLRKFMDLLENHAQNDPLFAYMRKLVNKGQNVNFSLISRLKDDFTGIQQVNIKRKLKIDFNPDKQSEWNPVEYFNLNRTYEDELYKQFAEEEGRIYQLVIQQIIQTFYTRGLILNTKIQNYLNSVPSHKQVFLYQLTVSSLVSKYFKSAHPIVQASLLLSIIHAFNDKIVEESSSGLTKNQLTKMVENLIFEVFNKGQNLDFNSIISAANLISFVINGWKQEWNWEGFIENQSSYVKRRILLNLILQKTRLLNQNFTLAECFASFPHYQLPQNLTNQIEYKTADEMEEFQKFQKALSSKSNAETVKQIITTQHDYELFLEALFRRTSLSQTHFKTLIERYKQVLVSEKEFDWALINKIRNFWKKSYLNRQSYLQTMIKSEFITFNSYVNYIGQLKDKNQKQMIWIKIQLNQLNNMFGNANKKGK